MDKPRWECGDYIWDYRLVFDVGYAHHELATLERGGGPDDTNDTKEWLVTPMIGESVWLPSSLTPDKAKAAAEAHVRGQLRELADKLGTMS